MIPEFEKKGYLPPGVHPATLAQIEKRYAYNPVRRRLFEGLRKLARNLKEAGCKTLYLNGSYITDKNEPGDYDAVWEYEGVNMGLDPLLRNGWDMKEIKRKYGGDVFCRMPEVLRKDHLEFFQTDRDGMPKGIIKIDLRKRL